MLDYQRSIINEIILLVWFNLNPGILVVNSAQTRRPLQRWLLLLFDLYLDDAPLVRCMVLRHLWCDHVRKLRLIQVVVHEGGLFVEVFASDAAGELAGLSNIDILSNATTLAWQLIHHDLKLVVV